MTHDQSTTSARADDVRAHERAQYATPPSLPSLPALPNNNYSPSIQRRVPAREPRDDMDGTPEHIRQAMFELLCSLVAGGSS